MATQNTTMNHDPKAQAEKLKALDKINSAETPPFLFTRIQQGVVNLRNQSFSKKTALSFAISFVLLIAINFIFIEQLIKKNNQPKEIETVANAMQLSTNNYLYHEQD